MLLSSCDDDKMDWHSPIPEGGSPVSIEELPISNTEELAQYKNIKEYMKQYMPGVPVGIGLTADMYLNSEDGYSKVCDDNFQQYVTGNAMKMGVMLNNKGEFNFATVDAYIAKAKESNPDVEFYGHNLIWHTQQRQDWLKSLINPKQVVTSDGGGISNMVGNSEFEDNLAGWSGWNNNVRTQVDGGHKGSDKCMLIEIDGEKSSNSWDDQIVYEFGEALTPGTTYSYKFWAKSEGAGAFLQFFAQMPWASGVTQQQQYGANLSLTTDWQLYEGEMTIADANDQINRVGFQAGGQSAKIYVDGVEFGPKAEAVDKMLNIVVNSGLDDQSTTGWGAWSSAGCKLALSDEGDGHDSKYSAKITNPVAGDNFSAQAYYTLPESEYKVGDTYILSYWYKADHIDPDFQSEWQNRSSYSAKKYFHSAITEADTWLYFEEEFVLSEDMVALAESNPDKMHITFDCGAGEGNVWVDDLKFGKKRETLSKRGLSKAISYQIKPDAEKAEIIDNAMKQWITGMVSHYKNDVKVWEVVNECIADGSYAVRGVNGKGFSGDDGVPTESEAEGLNLNWESGAGNQHFYWGYFLGKNFAVKAFQYARQAAGNDAKLYINEYNLEVSDGKLEALIDYVKYIDQTNGSAIVDGIGTQMHIQCFSTSSEESREKAKAGIDNMFTKLAATGKLVRISELDVAIGGESTSALLQAQSDTYQYVIESYIKNVPEAQRGGICFWTLSDNEKEHEYWLNGDQPNLFDKNYARKPAYKGVCNGIAGEDLSLGFDHTQW